MSPKKFRVEAPTRADLAGGTVDIWPLYCLFQSAQTINGALSSYAKAEFVVSPSVAFQLEVSNGSERVLLEEEQIRTFELDKISPSIRFPTWVAAAFLREQNLPENRVHFTFSTEAPRQSGLGGSSALCVAVLRGLSEIFMKNPGPDWQWRILARAKDIEAHFLKTPTGSQDYLASLFGGLRAYDFRLGETVQKSYSDEAFRGLSDRMIVLFSGEMHDSGISNWEIYKGALEGKGEMVNGLSEVRGVAEDLNSVLSKSSLSWNEVGKLISAEWEIRRRLFKVETNKLKEITNFLDRQPILGRKVCGAASGGSLLVLVDPENRKAVIDACQEQKIAVLNSKPSQKGVTIS